MRSELLSSLLKEVSRSFYLTMRILPARIRPQIGTAYLLARTTDTIADTGVISVESRLSALRQLREKISGTDSGALNFGALAKNQSLPAERVLLERAEEAVSLLDGFSEADRQRIRDVLNIITSGQELDLKRFSCASAERIVALQSETELDDYTYRVAGCVGEFWTKVCHAHLFPGLNVDQLVPDSIRFGKGLQLVNILRDVPRDLRNGRCYFPEPRLRQLGLAPQDLLAPERETTFRPLYDQYLAMAESHLEAGWRYTIQLPRKQVRLRLACAWPILIGVETLRKLKNGPILDPGHTIKVSRRDIRRIVVRSITTYPFKNLWESQLCKGPL
ncbi:MAG: phytoene/squalene synthase family protein [Limisphaerales bacterium]